VTGEASAREGHAGRGFVRCGASARFMGTCGRRRGRRNSPTPCRHSPRRGCRKSLRRGTPRRTPKAPYPRRRSPHTRQRTCPGPRMRTGRMAAPSFAARKAQRGPRSTPCRRSLPWSRIRSTTNQRHCPACPVAPRRPDPFGRPRFHRARQRPSHERAFQRRWWAGPRCRPHTPTTREAARDSQASPLRYLQRAASESSVQRCNWCANVRAAGERSGMAIAHAVANQ
jgi:hypothetical protein